MMDRLGDVELYIAPVAVLNFSVEEEHDEVTVLFGEFTSCDIYGLKARKLNMIGCTFGEGLIENSTIGTVSFFHCYQEQGTQLDFSISEIEKVEVSNSSLKIVHPIGTTTEYGYRGNLPNQLEAAFKPFGYPYDDISSQDIDRVKQLLSDYPENKLLTYNIPVWVLNHEEDTGRIFLPIIMNRVLNLPEEEKEHFRKFFRYLVEDEYKYLQESEKVMTFIESGEK